MYFFIILYLTDTLTKRFLAQYTPSTWRIPLANLYIHDIDSLFYWMQTKSGLRLSSLM